MSYLDRQESISSLVSSSTGNIHPRNIGPWRLGKTLGRGATGRVLLATHLQTGQKAAVKVVSKSELGEEESRKPSGDGGLPYGIEREIIIMKLLTHPNVLRLYDVWETSKALYLVLEYVEGGELFDLLVERGPLQEVEAVKYFRQVILGTAYCHALGICHRDLKPENLLLDSGLNVKLADFGMAALESNGKLLETSCGSPHYAAPEIVSGLKYHGAASDIWSCGVILFALLTGRLPFDDENIRNLLLKVQAGNFDMPSELSPEAQDLIDKMLTVDPAKRIKTNKIIQHPLLSKYPIPNEDLISVKSLPHPETAYKSLGSAKNIDKQILQNLSILWHDRSQDDIVECLLKNGSNPEKTFYALLMRYRHSQEEPVSTPSRQNSQVGRPGSRESRKKRVSQISASTPKNRPVLFQFKNGVRGSQLNGRLSTLSSANNSPYQSPSRRWSKRTSEIHSPRASPVKYRGYKEEPYTKAPPIPKNLYKDIVTAQENGSLGSMPPSLPSKDTINDPQNTENPDLAGPLEASKFSPSKNKRNSKRNSVSKNRLSRRKSLRASLTTGLKRNSVTMKLLSTYAKLSSESEWEYMDKQTRRTSATFATLCDKIFNQEQYDEEDEQLIDEEEKQAREYEKLMEMERKKREGEARARKELQKQLKRQKRRSLLSSKKLSIMVKDDANNSERVLLSEDVNAISQPKRQDNKALRSISEGAPQIGDDLTREELENLKRRSVTQPVQRRRRTPILTRRPVSRLDPLWLAHENEELNRAQDALEDEYRHANLETKKKINRESMVSVDHEYGAKRSSFQDLADEIPARESNEYDLPEPDVDGSVIVDDYAADTKKGKGRNSLLNAKPVSKKKNRESKTKSKEDGEPRTLIGDVNIPTVTRKSRCFTNSNKRLSVISMYSTKESYRDLNSIIRDEGEPEESTKMPSLRTSFADRLDKAGLSEENEMEPLDDDSVLDFDEHLANRDSYYNSPGDVNSKRFSRYSSVKRKSQPPTSELPSVPDNNPDQEYEDDTFVTKNDEVHRNRNSKAKRQNPDDDDKVFENIKLPDQKQNRPATKKTERAEVKKPSLVEAAQPRVSDPYKKVDTAKPPPQPYPKVRQPKLAREKAEKAFTPTEASKPLQDSTNKPSEDTGKRSKSIFRKLSWGSKKTLDVPTNQLPSPADSRDPSVEGKSKSRSGFFKWLSSNNSSTSMDSEIKRFKTILPKQEMSTALYSLLSSWTNFGLKGLKNDNLGFNIIGEISKHNAFNLKHCKFRIKINPREFNQKSEIVCARVKGSKVTADTLFKEIEKVLRKENVMDI